ncbi:MAG: trimeric intracellular cation channel family protein [Agriterribacter sp.]
MDKLHSLYTFIDLAGTFAFAISGAVAAKQKGLDVFGILVVAFTVACGGGITRDLCIGAIPPAGLSDWRYLLVSTIATIIAIGLTPLMKLLHRPVILFDAFGLSLFAVSGVDKTLDYGYNNEIAVLLGIITAVGGGVIRDIFLNRIPVIFEREIYAAAALLGAITVITGHYLNLPDDWIMPVGFIVCLTVRLLALKYHWKLPAFSERQGA